MISCSFSSDECLTELKHDLYTKKTGKLSLHFIVSVSDFENYSEENTKFKFKQYFAVNLIKCFEQHNSETLTPKHYMLHLEIILKVFTAENNFA